MLAAILLILIVLWLLGYGPIEAFYIPLFSFNGRTISVWDILIFVVIMSLVGFLPGPFRAIAAVAVLLWLLAILGIIAVAGFNNILLISVIVGLVLYLLGGL